MGRCNYVRHFFPLTGFQIGDLQSYLSDLSFFLALESRTFYVLVDNRPWLEDLVSGPAHLWQLMVTKSRMSPFAITRGRKGSKEDPEASSKSQKLKRWFSMTTLSRKRALLPVKKLRTSLLANSKLHRTLYGFIVFEVAWKDVRGINYLNELQTDTSLAIEAKCMKRWEFDSIAQAAKGITSWFPGTPHEGFLLEQHLNSMLGDVFHEPDMEFSNCCDDEKILTVDVLAEDECSVSPSISSLDDQSETLEDLTNIQHMIPRRKLTNYPDNDIDSDINTESSYSGTTSTQIPSPCPSEYEEANEATQYRDVLLLFRFNDRDLPFELQQIVMSELRLLTLLEAGLPSWVIFFQSYPVFSNVYRPWMCPLARGLYGAISLVTVVIGFYDLYKNIPVLKATASRLCGPLFDWIETWEMVSRIKYLGTMLFLHNAEKAIMWFLMVTRSVRSIFSVLTQPLVAPFLVFLDALFPFWGLFIRIGDSFYSVVWILLGTSWNAVENLVEILLLPVWFVSSVVSVFATGVMYPIFICLWGILYYPIRLVLGLSNFVGFIYQHIYRLVGDLWLLVSRILKVASSAEATVHTYEVSMWRALWNDLFSQIFRALKSILYGVVAFFTACNRHRLSIYNHTMEFIRRLYQPAQRTEFLSSNKVQKPGIKTPPPEVRERRPPLLLPKKNTKQS